MEEDLIEESAFRSKKPTNTPRERVQNHLQTSTNEKNRQAKYKQQEGEEVFLVTGESGSFDKFSKHFFKINKFYNLCSHSAALLCNFLKIVNFFKIVF